jgi:hypothetical protein
MLICTFYLICFSAPSGGPDIEGGDVHTQSDVRQDEEEPCNHFIAFTLFCPLFFSIAPLTIWHFFLCIANHYISVLQMVFQIITTSNSFKLVSFIMQQ